MIIEYDTSLKTGGAESEENMDNEFKSVCDKCYQGTWYETEQPCKRMVWHGCNTCGSHEIIDKQSICTGTLRVIDTSDLNAEFKQYHKSGQRVEVRFSYGETKRGYIGKTTGWKPVYLLIARSNSTGSSDIIGKEDIVVKTINRFR